MHPQLAAIAAELEAAGERLAALAGTVPDAAWTRRPGPERWSAAECVAHLNLTSIAYLPLLRDALARARAVSAPPAKRYRRDLFGWLLWRGMGPPVRFRMHTTAPFVPTGQAPKAELVAEFGRLQRELQACVWGGEGLPLTRVKVISPFDARLGYNLYACLTIIPRHQHRHLWQAERAWEAIRASAG